MRGLFAVTVFLGAFLLFQVQPIVGKQLLPWFGGSAAVWTTCLLFFQSGLLLGYAYAHASVRWLTPVQQSRLHLGLLAASLLALPIVADVTRAPPGGAEPIATLLLLLAATVGAPYALLATTSPLLQAWHARAWPERDPYRLFALSNLASLLALLLYPLVIEPWTTTRNQALAWSAAYLVFVLTCGVLAFRLSRLPAATVPADVGESEPVPLSRYALWLLLATLPSVLLLAVTTRLTGDIAPVPLLWVVPLALYLLSFVIVFDRPRWYARVLWWPLLAAGLGWSADLLVLADHGLLLSRTAPVLLATLFVACVVGHGELARSRPHPSRLTGYYLAIAAGGALGGVLVAVIAPLTLDNYHELPLALIGLPLVALVAWWCEEDSLLRSGWWRLLPPLALAGVAALGIHLQQGLMTPGPEVRLWARNFYGTLEVSENHIGSRLARSMQHGGIEHGSQWLDSDLRTTPTTYYGRRSGIGRLLDEARSATPQRVGLVGLGVGTLAAYARPGDVYRFYEINPLVVELARSQFTWLSDSAGHIEMVMGDARLSLAREPAQQYDTIVVDAFNGDAIPVHLLTREAFLEYRRHLKPDGVIAVHTSNRYLMLEPVVQRGAEALGFVAHFLESEDDLAAGLNWTSWVLVTEGFNERLPMALWLDTQVIEADPAVQPWTDDHSSLFEVLVLP